MRTEDILKIIKRCLKPVQTRIAMLVGRCVLLATNDAQGMQRVNLGVMAGETLEDIERFQNYGMTSHCPDGSEGVAVFPLGNREHGICVVMDNRQFRLKNLAKGEVALYTDEGDNITLKRGNNIEINAANSVTVNTSEANVNASTSATVTTALATIDSPTTEVTGNMNIGGNLVVTGDTTSENVTALTGMDATNINASTSLIVASQELNQYESHTHNYDDDGVTETTGPVN